jgi:hypothetical protein
MKITDGQLRLSASDVANFLACQQLTQLDLQAARGDLTRPGPGHHRRQPGPDPGVLPHPPADDPGQRPMPGLGNPRLSRLWVIARLLSSGVLGSWSWGVLRLNQLRPCGIERMTAAISSGVRAGTGSGVVSSRAGRRASVSRAR